MRKRVQANESGRPPYDRLLTPSTLGVEGRAISYKYGTPILLGLNQFINSKSTLIYKSLSQGRASFLLLYALPLLAGPLQRR